MDLPKTSFYKIPLYCASTGLIFGIVEFAVNIYLYPWVLHNAGKFIPGIVIYTLCSGLVGSLLSVPYYVVRFQDNKWLRILKADYFYLSLFLTLLSFIWLYCKVYDVFGSGVQSVSLRYAHIIIGLVFFSLIFGLLVYLLLRRKKRPVEEFVALSIAWFTFVSIESYINFELQLGLLSQQNILNNFLALAGSMGLYFALHYILSRPSRIKGSVFGILIFIGVFAGAWGKDYRLDKKNRQEISRKVALLNKEQLLAAQEPNIILLSPDALRADHLSCYGYERIKTRSIDKIASQGVLFTNCISQAPWTLPSFASMLTSLYPTSNRGHIRRVALHHPKFYAVNPNVVWLQEVLKDIGYTTQAFVNNPSLEPAFGFNRGFDDHSNLRAPERVELKRAFLWTSIVHYLKGTQYKNRTQVITEKVVEWLENHPKQPFFLWVHYLDPHAPYERQNRKKYYEFPDYRGSLLDADGILGTYSKEKNYSEEERDVIKSLYDEEILYVDENIGLIMQKLEELNLTKDTLVIIVSDHGDEFWDRSNLFANHGQSLHRELLHVPLIFSLPSWLPSGTIKTAQVRCVDIMPTVLDILGVKYGFPLQGESLLPIIEGKDSRNRIAYSEYTFSREEEDKSFSTGEYKLIYSIESEVMQLYDLVNDPYEKNNIIDEKPELGLELKNQLLAWIDKAEELRQELIEGVEVAEPLELDSQTRERLKALGYLQ